VIFFKRYNFPTACLNNFFQYKENYFEKDASILVIHSGGLQGNRSLPAGTLKF
jgi:1-aminocyclopropane-1-carboxylate deaminase/D-cysteine desulfhydrase-like pyridoxal-dependent ACC family enzyme